MAPELKQGGDMPARAFPHTPPKVPNLFGKGALEKKVRYSLFTIVVENTDGSPLESLLAEIIPSKATIVNQNPKEKVTLRPRKTIPNFLPPRDLHLTKKLLRQGKVPRRNRIFVRRSTSPSQNIRFLQRATLPRRQYLR